MKIWNQWFITAVEAGALVVMLALLALEGIQSRDALAQGNLIYVDADATGLNNGCSWEDAFTTLQPALDMAVVGDQIWVAEGIYTPTYVFSPGDLRSATFQLKNGVALYGGFDPTVGDVGWADRDWVSNVTILSGDIGTAGDPGDNSYHVFFHPPELALDGTAVLDGFTIADGNAKGEVLIPGGGGMHNDGSSPTVTNCTFSGNSAESVGGGMYNHSSSPTVTNCTFSGNSAESVGGGMYNGSSSPVVINCTFSGNTASYYGGGMFNEGSSPTVSDCTFLGNTASYYGGGMYNAGSSPTVTNCTFSGNTASYYGGGMFNHADSLPIVSNSIFWGDSPDEISDSVSEPAITYSDIQGGYDGTGNIDADPLFVDQSSDDYHLRPDSPCIDAGTNNALNLPDFDFEGDPRVMDSDGDGIAIVEMGIDELFGYALYLPLVISGY